MTGSARTRRNTCAWMATITLRGRCFILKAIPTTSACDDSSKTAINSSARLLRLRQLPLIPKAARRCGRATILLPEDTQPTKAVLTEMPAKKFLRLVGEKREDVSVSLLHA